MRSLGVCVRRTRKDLWPCAARWAWHNHAEEDQPGEDPARVLIVSVGTAAGVAMTSTRETTEADVAYIGEEETLRQAGHRMRQLGVAVLPVCREDGSLEGIITRDMVIERIAAGGDPKTVTVGETSCHAPVLSPDGGNGGGHSYLTFAFRNISRTTCIFDRVPIRGRYPVTVTITFPANDAVITVTPAGGWNPLPRHRAEYRSHSNPGLVSATSSDRRNQRGIRGTSSGWLGGAVWPCPGCLLCAGVKVMDDNGRSWSQQA
jgi:CBS domain-containing protein